MILTEIAEVDVKLLSEQKVNLDIRRDLIASLEQTHCGPEDQEGDNDSESRPSKKARKSASAEQENLASLTKQVLFMLENRVAASRVKGTLDSAAKLLQTLLSSSSDPEDLSEHLHSRWSLSRHLLILDGAVDRCTSDLLFQHREHERFAGVALVSDESPPSQPRFRGLRFQITVMYWGTFAPVEHWEHSAGPPIRVSSCLGDITHCPGKKGVDVSRVIEKQLARVGLNCFDVCSGTGDGGGENEGSSGVHAYFENLNPGYVRRRCIPHISCLENL